MVTRALALAAGKVENSGPVAQGDVRVARRVRSPDLNSRGRQRTDVASIKIDILATAGTQLNCPARYGRTSLQRSIEMADGIAGIAGETVSVDQISSGPRPTRGKNYYDADHQQKTSIPAACFDPFHKKKRMLQFPVRTPHVYKEHFLDTRGMF